MFNCCVLVLELLLILLYMYMMAIEGILFHSTNGSCSYNSNEQCQL